MSSELERIDATIREQMHQLLASYARRRPVRSVAVVGNAPLDTNAGRAAAIDSADLVIRVNSFVLDQPHGEPCHGRETDVVVINRATRATPWMLENYQRRAYLQSDTALVHQRRIRYRTAPYWPADSGFWQIPNRALNAELRDLIWPGYQDVRVDPTTGTLAAWLGYRLFPEAEVRLTGYSYLNGERPETWEHHFGGEVPVSEAHRVDREGRLMSSWVAEGRAVVLS